MSYDRKYLILALSYLVFGMSLRIVMAALHNHGQHVTHAHINLVGFVLSLLYGVIYRLWLSISPLSITRAQFYLHHAGAVAMFTGLMLLYGGVATEELIEPLLATASLTVLCAALSLLYLLVRVPSQVAATESETNS